MYCRKFRTEVSSGIASSPSSRPMLVVRVVIVCFVRFYFDSERLWLAWTVCCLRGLALILSFTMGQNLFFREMTTLKLDND